MALFVIFVKEVIFMPRRRPRRRWRNGINGNNQNDVQRNNQAVEEQQQGNGGVGGLGSIANGALGLAVGTLGLVGSVASASLSAEQYKKACDDYYDGNFNNSGDFNKLHHACMNVTEATAGSLDGNSTINSTLGTVATTVSSLVTSTTEALSSTLPSVFSHTAPTTTVPTTLNSTTNGPDDSGNWIIPVTVVVQWLSVGLGAAALLRSAWNRWNQGEKENDKSGNSEEKNQLQEIVVTQPGGGGEKKQSVRGILKGSNKSKNGNDKKGKKTHGRSDNNKLLKTRF